MKTKLLKKLRKNIKLIYNKNTDSYYIYDGYFGDLYTTEREKLFLLSINTYRFRDKESRLRFARYEYRVHILMRARDIYLPIRINNNSWWDKLFAYCG